MLLFSLPMQYNVENQKKLQVVDFNIVFSGWHTCSQWNIQKLNSICELSSTEFGNWTKLNTDLCARWISEPIELNETNQTESNSVHYICLIGFGSQTQMDCNRMWSVNKFSCTKIMIYGLKNMKNMRCMEVTRALKNLLFFNTSFTKNKESKNQKFNLVQPSNYFCVSSIWLALFSGSLILPPQEAVRWDSGNEVGDKLLVWFTCSSTRFSWLWVCWGIYHFFCTGSQWASSFIVFYFKDCN